MEEPIKIQTGAHSGRRVKRDASLAKPKPTAAVPVIVKAAEETVAIVPEPVLVEEVKVVAEVVEPAGDAAETTTGGEGVPTSPGSVALEPIAAPLKRPWYEPGVKFSRRKIIASVSVLLLVAVSAVGYKAVMASHHIVTKNSGSGAPALKSTPIDPTKLKGEGDGRINILLLGVGDDGHAGGKLSDTIMVASIDPVNKNIAMLSIPRDLYVKIPGYGYGKINAANSDGGPELAKQVVSQVLDLPIHYYAQVDFSGFKQAVDSVGGVDIANATKLYDPEYPCADESGYCTFNLPIGQYHMNGDLALKFARCRHGLCGNDFGRAARQQQVLVAIRQKALQASTLTNPVKVATLIDSIGDHVRTDLQLNEMQKLAKMMKDVDVANATNKVLDNTDDGVLKSGDSQFPGAGSILIPKAGAFDYTDIQALAHSIFVDRFLKSENAAVQVKNGTLTGGMGAAVAKQLAAYNYNVVDVTTADVQGQQLSSIIDYTGGKKPYTIKYLEDRFGVKAQKVARPEIPTGQVNPDIVVTVGANYSLTGSATTTTTKP